MSRSRRAAIVNEFEHAIDMAVARLEGTDDQLIRARLASQLVEAARHAQERFGEERTNAYVALRELGWSLGDLASEFGQTRARTAQIAVRERYKSGESRGGGGKPRRA